ncbi:MAG: MFS transporter [Polyangiales bacterium]
MSPQVAVPAAARAEQVAEPDRQRALLLALGAGAFMVNLDSRVVAPLLPLMANELHVSLTQAGWLVSAYMLPYGLFQLAYGPIADRIGKINVCAHALAAFSVGTALCAYWPSFGAIVALRALTGAAAAGLIPLTIAYIGDTVPYDRRQAALAALMASSGAANAFSTSAGGSIAAAFSWRAVFPCLGILSGVVTIALYALRGRALHVQSGTRPSFVAAARTPRLARLLLLVGTEGFLYQGAFSYLSGLLDRRFGWSTSQIGLGLALTGVAQLLTATVVSRWFGRLSQSALLLTGGAAVSGAFVACGFAPNGGVVALACALLGGGFIACHTTLQMHATEALPASRATALALFAFSLFLGSGLGAVSAGAALPLLGFTWLFVGTGLAFLVFALVADKTLAREHT